MIDVSVHAAMMHRSRWVIWFTAAGVDFKNKTCPPLSAWTAKVFRINGLCQYVRSSTILRH